MAKTAPDAALRAFSLGWRPTGSAKLSQMPRGVAVTVRSRVGFLNFEPLFIILPCLRAMSSEPGRVSSRGPRGLHKYL